MTTEVLELPSSSSASPTTSTARANRKCKGDSGKCPLKVHAGDWCKSHYWRWQHHTDTDSPIAKKRKRRLIPLTCKADGCERPHHAAGYCTVHYRRAKGYTKKPVNDSIRVVAAGQHCTPEGGPPCGRKVKAGLLCVTHWERKRLGDPNWNRAIEPRAKRRKGVTYISQLRVSDLVLGQLIAVSEGRGMKVMEVVDEVLELWARERVGRFGKMRLDDDVERVNPWTRISEE